MVHQILKSKSNWSKININEKIFLSFWLFIGTCFVWNNFFYNSDILTYVLRIIASSFAMFIFFMANRAKEAKSNFIFQNAPLSEIEYKIVVNNNFFTMFMYIAFPMIMSNLFALLPTFLSIMVSLLWVSIFFFPALDGFANPNLLKEKIIKMEEQRLQADNVQSQKVFVTIIFSILLIALILILYDINFR